MNSSIIRHPNRGERRLRRFRQRNRVGATAVEFAVVAPVFILASFFCFDMGRAWIDASFIEQAAFEVARDISVLGARIEEARPVAQRELSIIGVEDFNLEVRVFRDAIEQRNIRDNSTALEVTLEVPLNELAFLSSFFKKRSIRRTAFLKTNRP